MINNNQDLMIPNEIIDNLYLGARPSAENLKVLELVNITHILNVTKRVPNFHEKMIVDSTEEPKFTYMQIPIEDSLDLDIYNHFLSATQFIDEVLKNKNNKILVHCEAGQSRSASMVLAYLLKYKNLFLKDALSLVKEKRDCISPNIGFLKSLTRLENE